MQIIHSRVYAQALTLGCLVGSAAAEMYDREYGSGQQEEADPFAYKAPATATARGR